MSGVLYTFLVLAQVAFLWCAPPPQKCKVSDSDCLKKVAQAMVPSFTDGILGTDPLDAMHVDEIKGDLSGLRFDLTNVVMTGLKSTVIDKIGMDMDKKQLTVVCHSNVNISSHYKVEGQLMVMPMSGDGDQKMQLTNIVVKYSIPFIIVKNKEGKDAMHMKEYKWDYEVKGGAKYELNNLFNGNKALSDPLVKFMNENWKVICEEFGGLVIEKPTKKVFNAIRKYMQSMPLNEIVDV